MHDNTERFILSHCSRFAGILLICIKIFCVYHTRLPGA